jgi:hypothetical protein
MRLVHVTFLVLAACGGGELSNLPLQWRGVGSSPAPNPNVAASFAAVPLAFSVHDVRTDPTAVGMEEDSGFIVRTTDNVAQYCGAKMAAMLAQAGARLNEVPLASVDAELLEYKVVEGNTFHGMVRVRVVVRRGAGQAWAKIYEGKSRRFGHSHSPDNFNEALSNALADATAQLVRDEEFGQVLSVVVPPPGVRVGG